MVRKLIPTKEIRNETIVANSRFLTTIKPTFTVEEARNFISRIKTEFADASHNVPAFIIGHGLSQTSHCSDDGEPMGTAGRPALAVLRGSGLGDVAVVVTRYFGGTKLGRGGLVRAYGDAVREILAITPKGEKISTHTVQVTFAYNLFEKVKRIIDQHQGIILDQRFGAEVTFNFLIPIQQLKIIKYSFNDISQGTMQADVLTTNEETIIPVDPDR